MTPSLDYLLDRRRLRRQVTFWRIFSFSVIFLFLLLVFGYTYDDRNFVGDHIARVEISGFVSGDSDLVSLLDDVGMDDSVVGVVLVIDSPGGTAVGGEILHSSVRLLSSRKPTVTSVGSLATSAAYMIAAGSDYIVAHHTSIVGSIGVIAHYPEVHGLLDKLGVRMNEIKSAPLKSEPSPFSERDPASELMLQTVVDDSYNWFVDLVTSRRPLSRSEVLSLSDGSIYTGRLAVDLGLIDALGGIDVARSWLIEERAVSPDVEIIDWYIESDSFGSFSASITGWLWGIIFDFFRERVHLDGLLSIWHGRV